MALINPFSITYGGFSVGGSSQVYLLHGPYLIDKAFATIRVTFDVVVVSGSHSGLKSAADALEVAFSARDQTFSISLSGSTWTYTFGTSVLNSTATLSKSGDRDLDRGYSRAYTCTITGELPAGDQNGLRDVEFTVDYEPSRRRLVNFRGVYTPHGGSTALATYQSDFDSEATTFLSSVDNSATWELVDEQYTLDRTKHTCNFTRQYAELLADQSSGTRDDTEIKDHRIQFTDLSSHPGDADESIYRMRRVVGAYDCSIDIEQTTDLQSVFDGKVKQHLIDLFENEFSPQVFCLESHRISYDETSKRMSVSFQFLYQAEGGGEVVEVSRSLAYRETRTIDYTPVHGEDELAFNADLGWAIVERVWSRTATVIGDAIPKRRISESPRSGPEGDFGQAVAGDTSTMADGTSVNDDGWNIISNVSQVSDQWMGDPNETQIKMSTITETVVERLHKKPQGGTKASIPTPKNVANRPKNPVTPNGNSPR